MNHRVSYSPPVLSLEFSKRYAAVALEETQVCLVVPNLGLSFIDKSDPTWKENLIRLLDEEYNVTDLYVAGREFPIFWENGKVHYDYNGGRLYYACESCGNVKCDLTKACLVARKSIWNTTYSLIREMHNWVKELFFNPEKEMEDGELACDCEK